MMVPKNCEAAALTRLNGLAPIRVLMADPDESFLVPYRAPLSREGFQVVTASSGRQCAARLRESAPHVLVLEPQLPGGGGARVLTMMSTTADLAMVPVMLLASCCDSYELDRMAQFPIDDYCIKPLTPDRLAARLHSLLDDPGPRFTLSAQERHLECLIIRRTGGRVHCLCVENLDGRVVVRGRSDSYYVKQLAIAAVMEACEAAARSPEEVELDIEVREIS